jgi:hypothetical protein
VAQKLFQNIFPNIVHHSHFTGPNRSRLIETNRQPCPPPPSDSGKKGVRAFFKMPMLSSPDSIPRDTKTGKTSARAPHGSRRLNLKITDKNHHSLPPEISNSSLALSFFPFQEIPLAHLSKILELSSPESKNRHDTKTGNIAPLRIPSPYPSAFCLLHPSSLTPHPSSLP